jgi:RNA polymerase sigma-70 factor (ECF subfamily)
MALMSFHAARTGSRLSAEGEVILLAGQDRSTWDRSLIAQGNDYMNRAASGDRITAYHIEAAIAFEHCTAETFGQTNWRQILIYYDWLVKINPAAVVSLNRMAVVFKIYGAAQALDEMRRSPHREAWEDHYLYHSLLGEIYTEADKAKAKACFEKAVTLTHSPAEKKLLQKRIRQLNAG